MTFTTWMILGLCTGFVRGDDELTFRLCESQFEAKMRHIPSPHMDDGFGKFGQALSRSRVLIIYRRDV